MQTELLNPVEHIHGWVNQDLSVMFQAVTPHCDPVELTVDEARAVAIALLKLAARLEACG